LDLVTLTEFTPSIRRPEAAAISAFMRVFDALWQPSKAARALVPSPFEAGAARGQFRVTDNN
jgi:hypothetical protein